MDEVIDVMQENISKVIERGERLDDLQDKSGKAWRAGILWGEGGEVAGQCLLFTRTRRYSGDATGRTKPDMNCYEGLGQLGYLTGPYDVGVV